MFTSARPKFTEFRQPTLGAIVYCFSYVESEIEATMIAGSQNKHEFSSFVLHLADLKLGIFLFEIIRVDQSSFMSHIFRAFGKMFRKVIFSLSFQNV